MVTLRGQAGAVLEHRVLHAQLRGPGVHFLHKGGLAARQVFRHGHRGVVARGHGDGLEHLVHGQLLSLLQEHLGAPHAGGVGGDGNHGVLGETAAVQGFLDEQKGHDLGDAGGLQGFVGVLLIEDLPGGFLHKNGRLGGHLRSRGPDGDGQEKDEGKEQSKVLFHRRTSRWFFVWLSLCGGGAGYARRKAPGAAFRVSSGAETGGRPVSQKALDKRRKAWYHATTYEKGLFFAPVSRLYPRKPWTRFGT